MRNPRPRVSASPLARIAVPLLIFTVAQPARSASLAKQISVIITKARTAPDIAKAEAKLSAAEQLLKRQGGKLNTIAREFIRADIAKGRGRAYLVAWQRKADQSSYRAKAETLLTQATSSYQALQAQCEKRANDLEDKYGDAVEGNSEYRVMVGNVSRANYAMAWTEYSLGLAVAAKQDKEKHLKRAVELFVSFTASGYRKHPIITDCFLGQTLALYELERYFEITQLLDGVTRGNTPAQTFKRMQYRLLEAQQGLSSHIKVETIAKQYFDSLPSGHKLDAIELEMAIVRAQSLVELIEKYKVERYKARFRKSLREVANLVRPYGSAWTSRIVEMIGDESTGGAFTHLTEAREHFNAKRYEEALKQAELGLNAATSKADEPFLPDLRYAKTASAWNLKRWTEAHDSASDFLRHHKEDRRAADVCRFAIQAAIQARTAQPPLPDETFLSFLTFAEENFPTHAEVQRAPWYRGNLLLQAEQYADAEKALIGVTQTSPVYRHALYGLALAGYKQADAMSGTEEMDLAAVARHLSDATRAVKRFVDSTKKGLPKDQGPMGKAVGDIAVATARLWLELSAPDHEAALSLLGCTDRLPELDAKAARQRGPLRVVANVLAGKIDVATDMLGKMVKQEAKDEYTASALIAVADPLEKEYERTTKANRPDVSKGLAEKLASIYAFLLKHIQAQADASPDQEIAIRRRLAQSLARLGKHSEAIPQFEWLKDKVPLGTAGDVLHGLATAYETAGKYTDAAEVWNTLSKGLKDKSDDWLEARYHLISCCVQAGDRERARKVMQFFRLTNASIPSKEWAAKFEALEKNLGGGE